MKVSELERQVKEAPDLPGVYLFRDPSESVLYVGKALSLRKRLVSYAPAIREGGRAPVKVAEMARRAESVEWIVASGDVEALLLEHNLIKRHHPPFNIRLRDDKSYPYIVITMEEEFPRVMFTRQPHTRGNVYFGPYGSAAKVRETLDALGRVFPFRKCRGVRPGRRSGSPCLQFHIKRCSAPCVGGVTADEYRETVQRVADFLAGRHGKILAAMEGEMKDAAGAQDFERAALLRDRVEALRHILERQQVKGTTQGPADIIGLARDAANANVQVFLTRDGLLADRRSFTLTGVEDASDADILERFLAEYYSTAVAVPPEIVVPRVSAELENLALFLEGLRGTKVNVRHAERGDKRRLQELADRNAALGLEHERLRTARSRERRLGALSSLQGSLGLEAPPIRIEGYDISNLGPEHVVASMVVFEGGAAKKSDYRKFAIRGFSSQDDFGALNQVISRRFTRKTDPDNPEYYDPSFESVPDLVLIDGGKGQLGAALEALVEAGLDGVVPVVSLAKREEEVFVPGRRAPLELSPDDPGVLLLRQIRDEAHRFAIGFHRVRRGSTATDSFLDGLPGVGEKRKRLILNHFGSPERFLDASREELEAVPGLPGKVARSIYAYVHKNG